MAPWVELPSTGKCPTAGIPRWLHPVTIQMRFGRESTRTGIATDRWTISRISVTIDRSLARILQRIDAGLEKYPV